MKRIRCVDLFARFEVLPIRMAEVVVQRDFWESLCNLDERLAERLREKWKEKSVPGILECALAFVRDSLDGNPSEVPLSSRVHADPHIVEFTGEDASVREVVEVAVQILDSRIAKTAAEIRHRIDGRQTLPWCDLHMALVPFTALCMPEMRNARKCWCGCWVEQGVLHCPFCGDVAPEGTPTRVWIRKPCRESQLDPMLEGQRDLEQKLEDLKAAGVLIPHGKDPEKYIAAMEHIDHAESEVLSELSE